MNSLIRVAILVAIAVLVVYAGLRLSGLLTTFRSPMARQFVRWASGDETERAGLVTIQRDACPGAPFILPTDGFIGLLYADPNPPYSQASPHQGIDIFSNAAPGIMPVYAAYAGYITREGSWRSALIQRVPEDPLKPERQIWLYYAHMADENGLSFIEPAFPPGTSEVFVDRGTLLGYTGDYNGGSLRDIWVHLHFSIVRDDGSGRYSNELDFANTIDPSTYLGLNLNYNCSDGTFQCTMNPSCN